MKDKTMSDEEEWSDGGTDEGEEEGQNGRKQPVGSTCQGSDAESEAKQRVYLGCLTRQQLVMSSVAAGLVLLLTIITVSAVVLTSTSGSSGPLPPFPVGGDMLDFLVQTGEISRADGILATWYHRANNKSEMNKALASDVMILEADVTVEGIGTPNQKPIPIMAHPPAISSDNTLDQWLEAVLKSRKGIKLDFKSLVSVAPSLDLLNKSRSINRPVWLNADIIRGPNVPDFMPVVNGTRFLQLIQEKFPDVTVSPGWKVNYVPPIFTGTYTRSMVEEMYDIIRHVPQKVTFPVHALLARRGWQHLSWLLSQSPRFSLTLWQGSVHPEVSDLLFVRDNSHPARVYYDIYEPTMSSFKQAAKQQGRVRQFYPGGNLMEFFYPTHNSDTNFLSGGSHFLPTDIDRHSLAVHWFTITDRASLLAQLSDGGGGMLVVQVGSSRDQPTVPVVQGSTSNSDPLTLQDLLDLVQTAYGPWGLYLGVQTHDLLEASLSMLNSAYSREQLYRPVWVHMEDSHSTSNTQVPDTSGQQFVSTVERLFPHVTLVLTEGSWPPQITPGLRGVSQRVAVRLRAELIPRRGEELDTLLRMMDKYDFIVDDRDGCIAVLVLIERMTQRTGSRNTRLYCMSDQSGAELLSQTDTSTNRPQNV
ncbi:protein FAM151A [Polymixia lowei]